MYSIIKVKESELKQISDMAEVIWKAYYTSFLPAEQIVYMLDKFYGLNALAQQVSEGHEFYFIQESEEKVGFISISKKEGSEFFIHKFYLYPGVHRKNAGTKLMEIIKNKFRNISDGGKIKIRLTVNRQNFKAINFYFKNGFIIEKVEDFDIGKGYFMNDFVMLFTDNIEKI